jgi:hypothetical protein
MRPNPIPRPTLPIQLQPTRHAERSLPVQRPALLEPMQQRQRRKGGRAVVQKGLESGRGGVQTVWRIEDRLVGAR